jgi:hypothetical protein
MVETKKVKSKNSVKPKEPVVKPKKPVVKPKVVKPKEPVVKPKVVKKITIEYQGQRDTLNENKYSEKIKILIAKIKNQNTEIDHGIRFCWKN